MAESVRENIENSLRQNFGLRGSQRFSVSRIPAYVEKLPCRQLFPCVWPTAC